MGRRRSHLHWHFFLGSSARRTFAELLISMIAHHVTTACIARRSGAGDVSLSVDELVGLKKCLRRHDICIEQKMAA